MKTTIKLNQDREIVIQPSKVTPGMVSVILENRASAIGQWGVTLTMDQVGALLFGLEQAALCAELAQERMAA
jgi:hypothetical protein